MVASLQPRYGLDRPLHVQYLKWISWTSPRRRRCSSSPRRNQDMSLAGSVVMVLSSLTVIGTLISDILLVAIDPRIREAV